jgi:WD40 repeat protein
MSFLSKIFKISNNKKDLKKAIARTEEYYKKGDYAKSFAILFKAWKGSNFSRNEDINRLYSMLMQKGRIKSLVFCFQKKILTGHTSWVNSVALTPDGRHVVSGGGYVDFTLRLWDLHTGQCLRTMEGHNGSIDSVALTPDGKHAVSGSYDKTLRLWDLHTGQCLRTMEGHTGSVNSVALTSDGKYAVSGNDDKTLRLWDLHTGQCLRTMEGHTDPVNSVVITPDGMYAVSGSHDNTLRLWEFIWDLEF